MSLRKVDLDDGFYRNSLTMDYALPFLRLTMAETAIWPLIKASAWGHATRNPGYTCDMTPVEMVDYLQGWWCKATIYNAIKGLRAKHLLTDDTESLTINPHFIEYLPPEVLERVEVRMETHNENKRYSRPALKSFRHESTPVDKKSTPVDSPNKDAHAGRERERLKSSSNIAMNILENAVPDSQTADDDEFKAQSQRLRQELARLGAQRTRKPEAELLAQIDSITGRTPQDLALGMARLIDRMRADDRWGPINLRGLLAVASDPANRNWGNATAQSVLSQLQTQAPAPPPVDQDALYAAALAAEREQRARRT